MALPLLQRAIEAQRKALAADPRVAQYRLFLHIHYRTLADCHLARRELAEAAAASAACAEAQPERAGLLVVAAERMVRCAELAAAGGDAGARKPYEDAALAYLERAVQSEPAQATVIAADKVLAPLQRRPEFAALTSAPASGTAADAATAGK